MNKYDNINRYANFIYIIYLIYLFHATQSKKIYSSSNYFT